MKVETGNLPYILYTGKRRFTSLKYKTMQIKGAFIAKEDTVIFDDSLAASALTDHQLFAP